MHACPTAEQLQRFLADELSQDDSLTIGSHVNGCPTCLRQMEEMTEAKSVDPGPSIGPESLPEADDLTTPLRNLDSATTIIPGAHSTLTFSPGAQPPGATVDWPEIPDYEILGEIGRGGMGVVYKARQISLHRQVALKMLLAGSGASEMVKARFRNEADAVARLQHVNIVQIFAVGEHNGSPYLTLELVEGVTLAHELNNTPQRPIASATMLEILARAMHVAHELGIVHRDLKPSNVIVKPSPASSSGSGEHKSPFKSGHSTLTSRTRSRWRSAILGLSPLSLKNEASRVSTAEGGDLGIPKITDFGLAKLLDDDAKLTRTGDIMGTPCYMAPEQAMAGARGSRSRDTVGPAADIYSLGAILYEMLTGRPPFKAKTTVETLLQVLHQDPVSPSRLQPRIPQDLTTICLKCLEKEPHKRYESALALAEDLRRFLNGEPVLARRVGPAGLMWRWAKRRPGLASMAVSLVMLLIGGYIGMTRLWLRAEGHRQSAEASSERAESSLYFSRTARAQLAWRLNDPSTTIALLDQCAPGSGEPDRRGWEWYYLKSLTKSELVAFDSGSEYVTKLAFSPDGNRLFVGGGDPFFKPATLGKVRVWDLGVDTTSRQPRLVNAVDEPTVMIRTFALSRDGGMLAFTTRAGAVKLWDTQKWQAIRTLPGGTEYVTSLSFSPDGKSLASIDHGGTLTVWDVQTGSSRFQAIAAKARFTMDGTQLIAVGRSESDPTGYPIVLDPATGAERSRLPFDATNFELSPDGRMMVVWAGFGARIVSANSGHVVASLDSHSGVITDASFSPDGLHVATASADQTARVSDARTGAEELIFRGHTVGVGSVAFHPSGRFLATADKTGNQVKIWDLSRRPEYANAGGEQRYPSNRRRGHSQRAVLGMGFGWDGQELLMVRADGSMLATDVHGGSGMRPAHPVPLNSQWLVPAKVAAVSPDGRSLAGVDRLQPNVVNVWDTSTGETQLALHGHKFQVFHVAGNARATRWATSGLDWRQTNRLRELKVWDAATGKLEAEFQPAGDPRRTRGIYGVAALSPDGELIAFDDFRDAATSRAADGTGPMHIRICRVSDGREFHDLPGHSESLTALEFSASGALLAAGYMDGLVMIHHLESRSPVPALRLQGPPVSLNSVAFSPDERLLAAADREQVQLWHVPTGEEVIVLRGAPPRPGDNGFNPLVVWSPDGRRLAGFNHDHTVSIWDRTGDGSVADRFKAADDRAFAWHLAHAEAALWDPQLKFAADLHVRALKRLEPQNELLYLEYAGLCAWMGRWKDAADLYARANSQHPFEFVSSRSDFGLLLYQVGDTAGWRKVCAEARDRFGYTNDGEVAQRLAHLCQLAPGGVERPEEFLRWVDLAVKRGIHLNSGLLLLVGSKYRIGRFREAIESFDYSRLQQHNLHPPGVAAMVAMAYSRLGETAQARVWIDRAEQWVADQDRVAAENPMVVMPRSVEWADWVEARILLAEARTVVKEAEAGKQAR